MPAETSSPTAPLEGSPPIVMPSVPEPAWVNWPATSSSAPAPIATVPLFEKSPAVVNDAPASRFKDPELEARPWTAPKLEPGPTVSSPALDSMATNAGRLSVAPARAFQLPPVSVVPPFVTSAIDELETASVPEAAAIVPELSRFPGESVVVPVPADLIIVPAFVRLYDPDTLPSPWKSSVPPVRFVTSP